MKLDELTRRQCALRIPYHLLRGKKGVGYYFDKNGIYCSCSLEEMYNNGKIGVHRRFDGSYWCSLYQPDFDGVSPRIVRRAITSLNVGDKIDKFFEFIENAQPNKIPLPSGIDRFITKIDAPSIERETGNKNTNTFDFIYVDVCIVKSWESDKKQYIKTNMPEIKKRVLEKIESSKKFQKYGVPINFLRVTSITLTRDDVLHFIFELKKI